MSFTKTAFQEGIFAPVSQIQKNTLHDNDLTEVMNCLNALIYIGDVIKMEDPDTIKFWNEIISDAISVIFASTSGFYRLSTSGLRSILETACHAFYFYDHKIELLLFINEDFQPDTVTNLINDKNFFTTKYIKTFNPNIILRQFTENSMSAHLKKTYFSLCDVVHGRYKALTKEEELEIGYDKEQYKKFETLYFHTIGAIVIMYHLRFKDKAKELNLDFLIRITGNILKK
jgi:hypothetical protein